MSSAAPAAAPSAGGKPPTHAAPFDLAPKPHMTYQFYPQHLVDVGTTITRLVDTPIRFDTDGFNSPKPWAPTYQVTCTDAKDHFQPFRLNLGDVLPGSYSKEGLQTPHDAFPIANGPRSFPTWTLDAFFKALNSVTMLEDAMCETDDRFDWIMELCYHGTDMSTEVMMKARNKVHRCLKQRANADKITSKWLFGGIEGEAIRWECGLDMFSLAPYLLIAVICKVRERFAIKGTPTGSMANYTVHMNKNQHYEAKSGNETITCAHYYNTPEPESKDWKAGDASPVDIFVGDLLLNAPHRAVNKSVVCFGTLFVGPAHEQDDTAACVAAERARFPSTAVQCIQITDSTDHRDIQIDVPGKVAVWTKPGVESTTRVTVNLNVKGAAIFKSAVPIPPVPITVREVANVAADEMMWTGTRAGPDLTYRMPWYNRVTTGRQEPRIIKTHAGFIVSNEPAPPKPPAGAGGGAAGAAAAASCSPMNTDG